MQRSGPEESAYAWMMPSERRVVFRNDGAALNIMLRARHAVTEIQREVRIASFKQAIKVILNSLYCFRIFYFLRSSKYIN